MTPAYIAKLDFIIKKISIRAQKINSLALYIIVRKHIIICDEKYFCYGLCCNSRPSFRQFI